MEVGPAKFDVIKVWIAQLALPCIWVVGRSWCGRGARACNIVIKQAITHYRTAQLELAATQMLERMFALPMLLFTTI